MFEITTLCYPQRGDKYLMLHRVKRENDINKNKWIGIGGHFEEGESPEDCIVREFREETGGIPENLVFRGIVTFIYKDITEFMHLFTCNIDSNFTSEADYNDEGVLEFISRDDIWKLELWEGDRIFLDLLDRDVPFFSLKLNYSDSGILEAACLNGSQMELFDELDSEGNRTGARVERNVAHRLGLPHETVHMWLWKKGNGPSGIDILLQKRSDNKDSNPGCFDISSAGHISCGDSPLPAAKRELFEELGIECEASDLVYVDRLYFETDGIFHGRPFHDREFSNVFTLHIDDQTKFVLQESEVSAVRFMDLDECIAAVECKNLELPNCLHLSELKRIREALGMAYDQ